MVLPDDDVQDARKLAKLAHAADRERLLPDEPVDSADADDVEHWISVYSQLVAFNREMIELVERRLNSSAGPGDGAEPADLAILKAHNERLSWRLELWSRSRSTLPRR